MDAQEVRRIWREANLAPLWESPSAHKPPRQPVPTTMWSWSDIRPLLDLAFQESSPTMIERRVLQLMSPYREGEDEYTVGTIQGAIQCLLPGESARPHRHTMNAIRFMIEGSGVTTTVDGKDCVMDYGDLVLTPAWCWHEHRHEGDVPALWLDVLDVPIHNYLGTAIFQPPPIMEMPKTMPDTVFSVPNILPEVVEGRTHHAPVFRYPYVDALKAVANAPASPDGGRRIRYVNPLDGGAATALIDCLLLEIGPGEQTKFWRENANALCLVVEGEGESTIGDVTRKWGPLDIFTIPQWNYTSHRCIEGPARIFIVSDREIMRKLQLHAGDLKPESA